MSAGGSTISPAVFEPIPKDDPLVGLLSPSLPQLPTIPKHRSGGFNNLTSHPLLDTHGTYAGGIVEPLRTTSDTRQVDGGFNNLTGQTGGDTQTTIVGGIIEPLPKQIRYPALPRGGSIISLADELAIPTTRSLVGLLSPCFKRSVTHT